RLHESALYDAPGGGCRSGAGLPPEGGLSVSLPRLGPEGVPVGASWIGCRGEACRLVLQVGGLLRPLHEDLLVRLDELQLPADLQFLLRLALAQPVDELAHDLIFP